MEKNVIFPLVDSFVTLQCWPLWQKDFFYIFLNTKKKEEIFINSVLPLFNISVNFGLEWTSNTHLNLRFEYCKKPIICPFILRTSKKKKWSGLWNKLQWRNSFDYLRLFALTKQILKLWFHLLSKSEFRTWWMGI